MVDRDFYDSKGSTSACGNFGSNNGDEVDNDAASSFIGFASSADGTDDDILLSNDGAQEGNTEDGDKKPAARPNVGADASFGRFAPAAAWAAEQGSDEDEDDSDDDSDNDDGDHQARASLDPFAAGLCGRHYAALSMSRNPTAPSMQFFFRGNSLQEGSFTFVRAYGWGFPFGGPPPPPPTWRTDLFVAIRQRRTLEEIQEVIASDPGAVQRHDGQGRLPLHVAAALDSSTEVVRLLATTHPRALRVQDIHGQAPLHAAAQHSSLGTVEYLAAEYPEATQLRDAEGRSPLFVAVRGDRVEAVQCLAALSAAALHGRDGNGQLPLHAAASRGRLDVVQFLAALSPDSLQERDGNGQLPLHVGVAAAGVLPTLDVPPFSFAHPILLETVEYLATEWPQAIQVRDDEGRTPLDVALVGYRPDVVQALATLAPEALRERDGSGHLPLHAAVARGRLDMVRILAALSPDSLHERDGSGQLPLHVAAARNSVDMLQVLAALSPGALLVADDLGRLPLHVAVSAAGADGTIIRSMSIASANHSSPPPPSSSPASSLALGAARPSLATAPNAHAVPTYPSSTPAAPFAFAQQHFSPSEEARPPLATVPNATARATELSSTPGAPFTFGQPLSPSDAAHAPREPEPTLVATESSSTVFPFTFGRPLFGSAPGPSSTADGFSFRRRLSPSGAALPGTERASNQNAGPTFSFAPLPDPWVAPILYLATQRAEALQARDADGRTPLHVAAASGASLDVLYELLKTFPLESLPHCT